MAQICVCSISTSGFSGRCGATTAQMLMELTPCPPILKLKRIQHDAVMGYELNQLLLGLRHSFRVLRLEVIRLGSIDPGEAFMEPISSDIPALEEIYLLHTYQIARELYERDVRLSCLWHRAPSLQARCATNAA